MIINCNQIKKSNIYYIKIFLFFKFNFNFIINNKNKKLNFKIYKKKLSNFLNIKKKRYFLN